MRLLGWPLGHERLRELLSAYLDAQLSPQERREVERHLESCAACRAELDGLRATVTLLRDAPAVTLRRSFTLTPAMADAEPSRPVMLQRPTLLPPAMLAGARYASAVAALLLIGVVSYDVASTVLPPATGGAASQAARSLAFEQMDAATKAAPPVPAAAPAQRQSAPGVTAAGAGGSAESAARPEPPVIPPSVAQDTAPGATPGPPGGAGAAMAPDSTAEDTAVATLQAPAPTASPAAEEPPRSAAPSLLRWLEATLATLLASAGALWFWGRRSA